MPMRPPIDQTLWDAAQNDRGPYDSVFAPRPDMGGPVGPGGGGFGVPSRSFSSPMEATMLPWDAQQQAPGAMGPADASRISELAKLLMGGGGPTPGAFNLNTSPLPQRPMESTGAAPNAAFLGTRG